MMSTLSAWHAALRRLVRAFATAFGPHRPPPRVPQAGAMPAAAAARQPAPRATAAPAAIARPDFSLSQFAAAEVSDGDPATYFDLMRAWQDTLVDEERADRAAPATAPLPWLDTMPMPPAAV
jgi:hypothetical protein